MKMYKIIPVLLASLALPAISACSNQSAVEQQVEQQTAAKAPPTLVETATIKQGADVSFFHNYDGKTDPGFTEDFQIFVQEQYASGTLDISMNASEGLTLSANGQTSFSMKGDEVRALNISVSAQNPGKYYVNLLASADTASGQVMRRSYGVAIYVGDPSLYPKAKQNGIVETTQDGGKIIVMQAEETIK
ncbi:MAG: hypothetical protein COA91_09835 [Robiginitomaculum sp.]|nr:MAG: hypothetical protein COA91_09835 [Robiginitomaculum sp.]